MVLLEVSILAAGDSPRPKAMPLLGRRSRCMLLRRLSGISESYPPSFLPPAILEMLKEPGRNEKRREERFSLGTSEFFRPKVKLGRLLLSLEGRGVGLSLLFGMAFRMLTGGCLRSRFSFDTGDAVDSLTLEERRLLLLPSSRSPMLPNVLERL